MLSGFLSDDPRAVLVALQPNQTSRAICSQDLAPELSCEGHVVVPRGVIHPAHRAWVLGCLELTEAQLAEQPLDFTASKLRELLEAARTPLAQQLRLEGIEPASLVLTRVPLSVSAGHHPFRTPQNAAWHAFVKACEALEKWQDQLPPVIVDAKELSLQDNFERLVHCRRTGTALFKPLSETTPLVGLPPPPRIWWDDSTKPLSVALGGDTVVLHLAHTVVQIDLESGMFSMVPIGFAQLVRLAKEQAIYQLDGDTGSLAVYDLRARRFVEAANELPKRFVRGACCGVEIWNVADRSYAIMPAKDLGSSAEVTLSGCGDYGWLELAPSIDDVGIFSINDARPVFQPWPHEVLERCPPSVVDETSDSTVRALGHTTSGDFCFFYGSWLCTPGGLLEVTDVRAAGFDAQAKHFACVGERTLRVLSLATGNWRRWSLEALFEHLQANSLLEGIDLTEEQLMGTVGTVSALAAMTPETLTEQLLERSREAPTEAQLSTLIGRARQVPLRWRL